MALTRSVILNAARPIKKNFQNKEQSTFTPLVSGGMASPPVVVWFSKSDLNLFTIQHRALTQQPLTVIVSNGNSCRG